MGGRPDDRRTEADANDRVRHRIRRACHRAVERGSGSRYLDDLAYHALRIPFVLRVLPEARIVHVVRDPIGAIPEMTYWWGRAADTLGAAIARKRAHLQIHTLPRLALRFVRNQLHGLLEGRPASWGPIVPGLDAFRDSHSRAEVAAFQWQRMLEIALDDLERLPPDRWLQVRYENLLREPADSVKRLAEFCEVEDPQALVEFGCRYLDPEHPVYAEVEPTGAEWSAIAERIGPVCSRLGYAPAPRSPANPT